MRGATREASRRRRAMMAMEIRVSRQIFSATPAAMAEGGRDRIRSGHGWQAAQARCWSWQDGPNYGRCGKHSGAWRRRFAPASGIGLWAPCPLVPLRSGPYVWASVPVSGGLYPPGPCLSAWPVSELCITSPPTFFSPLGVPPHLM